MRAIKTKRGKRRCEGRTTFRRQVLSELVFEGSVPGGMTEQGACHVMPCPGSVICSNAGVSPFVSPAL